jgi:hypothetical protein
MSDRAPHIASIDIQVTAATRVRDGWPREFLVAPAITSLPLLPKCALVFVPVMHAMGLDLLAPRQPTRLLTIDEGNSLAQMARLQDR